MSNTSTIIVRPLENYCGDCNVISLKPWIGTDYLNIPECQEIIYDLNHWQLVTALDKIDDLIDRKPALSLDLWRLKAEIFGLYDKYEDLYRQYEEILELVPNDPQSLFLTTFYGRMFNIPIIENEYFYMLQAYHPKLATELLDLVDFIEANANRTNFEEDLMAVDDIDLIGMFGYLVHPDGTLSETLEKRATKTLELSQYFPNAEVVVTGGAVNSTYVEAFGIREWLIDRGLDSERIIVDPFAKDTVGNIHAITNAIQQKNSKKSCLVTSLDHLPRCFIGVNAHLKSKNINCAINGAAFEAPYSLEISGAEAYRGYQTILRAAGYFTKSDFKK